MYSGYSVMRISEKNKAATERKIVMKKLIGGIVCVLIGLMLKFTNSTLFNIEVNGEKQAISGTLDLVAIVGLILIGIVLIASYFLSRKKN